MYARLAFFVRKMALGVAKLNFMPYICSTVSLILANLTFYSLKRATPGYQWRAAIRKDWADYKEFRGLKSYSFLSLDSKMAVRFFYAFK